MPKQNVVKPLLGISRRGRRMAASASFFTAFHLLNTIANSTLVFNRLDWGEDLFTEGEKRYVEQLRRRIHDNGEICRKLGHRLRVD